MAQNGSSHRAWEVGVDAERVTGSRMSTTALGFHGTWRPVDMWGLRLTVQHAYFDAPRAGLGATYDRRRIRWTLTLTWQPLTLETGPVQHSLRVHAGPAARFARRTRSDLAICATGLSPEEIDAFIERRFPKEVRTTDLGAAIRFGYGVKYKRVATRVGVTRRTYRTSRRPGWLVSSGVSVAVGVEF